MPQSTVLPPEKRPAVSRSLWEVSTAHGVTAAGDPRDSGTERPLIREKWQLHGFDHKLLVYMWIIGENCFILYLSLETNSTFILGCCEVSARVNVLLLCYLKRINICVAKFDRRCYSVRKIVVHL